MKVGSRNVLWTRYNKHCRNVKIKHMTFTHLKMTMCSRTNQIIINLTSWNVLSCPTKTQRHSTKKQCANTAAHIKRFFLLFFFEPPEQPSVADDRLSGVSLGFLWQIAEWKVLDLTDGCVHIVSSLWWPLWRHRPAH